MYFWIVLLSWLSSVYGIKIILVGLPKSGTTSFHQFFQKVGIKSVHWRTPSGSPSAETILQAKAQNLTLFHYLQDFEAITEYALVQFAKPPALCYFPQNSELERIYEENKDALFILNSRDVQKHARSMNAFTYYGRLLQLTCPDFLPGTKATPWQDRYAQFITDHNQKVRDFFAQHPEAKFLEFPIDKPDLSLLQPYFDTKGQTFPHALRNARLN